MYIITVIPIGRGMSKDTLTYFTRENISRGAIVTVPIRNSTAYGIVLSSLSATENKSEIKNLTFSIKKISTVQSQNFLLPEYMTAVEKIADYYATTAGSVLYTLIPKIILESHTPTPLPETTQTSEQYHETRLLQADVDERYATYKSLIREEFAKGRSVFFCLPTTEDIRNAHSILERGIEKYTYLLHSNLSKTTLVSLWSKIIVEEHPVLIIATGAFACIPRADIGTYIVEKESSRAYYSQSRPFIDMRTAIKIIGTERNAHVIYGDNLLRIETIWKQKSGEYSELAPLKFRFISSGKSSIVSMRHAEDSQGKHTPRFKIISDELRELLQNAKENNERTFLFCGRKGLAPSTVCSDCGTVVTCRVCSRPVVLYSPKLYEKGNVFVCNHCGEKRPADTLCVHCNGWRLTTLGIGIDTVAQEIQTLFPNSPLCIMDKDHISTHKQAIKMRDTFFESPDAICIGTEMAIPYLQQPHGEKVENAGAVSLDSFFSIPDFRITEKIFHILLDIRAFTQNTMLIQTRQPESSVGWKLIEYALKGNLFDFYRTEIDDRKTADYPPFVTFIKLSIRGEKTVIREKMKNIREDFSSYEMSVFETTSTRTEGGIHAIISLPHGSWVHTDLLNRLRLLPPSIEIKIDPDTLL